MAITLEGSSDYIIFFDDQHVQRFVTGFSVTMSANGSVGEAYIEMVYADAFMDIEYMTDVKIFVKNIVTISNIFINSPFFEKRIITLFL